MPHRRPAQEGFGIVVIALLFTAFAVIAAAALDRSTMQTEMNRQKQVEAQLSRLSLALAKYARYNDHRLPCPASWLRTVTDSNFGTSVQTSGTPLVPCQAGAVTPASDGMVLTGTGSKLLIGMVPVKELVPYGVSFDDAFDPWGSRIIYVVHRDLTPGTSDAAVAGATLAERPLVYDYQIGNTQPISPPPDTVVVSFGKDRIGGRLRNQGVLTNPAVACVAGRRGMNCDNDREFIRGPLLTSPRATDTTYFDDTVSTLRYTP